MEKQSSIQTCSSCRIEYVHIEGIHNDLCGRCEEDALSESYDGRDGSIESKAVPYVDDWSPE
jgi:hypothetical protein